jgi:hypothetical protein
MTAGPVPSRARAAARTGATLARSAARGAVRGLLAGAGMAAVGIGMNAAAVVLIARAMARSPEVGPAATALSLPLVVLVALVLSMAYLSLGVLHGRRVALRSWYETHRAEVIVAMDHVVRQAGERSPEALRRGSGAAWGRLTTTLAGAPRPLRLLVGWTLRRAGLDGLGRMVHGEPGGGAARLDAFIRENVLAASKRPFAILLAVNAAAAALVLLAIG